MEDEIVLGVISRPALGVAWWAVRGAGAFRSDVQDCFSDGAELRVSATASLSGGVVGVYSPTPDPIAEAVSNSGGEARRANASSHLVLDLAAGHVDAIVSDRSGAAWDHAPGIILTVEAGGAFVDPAGGRSPHLLGGLYTNGQIDDDLSRMIASLKPTRA